MILAVVGGKGGVGKSTVAYNLGVALEADESVVVDADLGMADLPSGRGPDLHDVLAGRADAVEAVRGGDSVALLPCGRSLAGARAADVRELEGTLRAVDREYGDVVVDCPAGMRADVGVPLAAADACLVVCSPRRFALADAVRTRELARELDAGLVGVALNRVVEDPPAEAIRELLGAPVTPIPADPRLGRSISENEPVVFAHPSSVAAAAFRELAAAVQSCKSV